MDSEMLLARENEFKKLNMQLEKKSENLLKRIENAVVDKVTVESVCKFLSAKVNLMQEQINNLQAAIDKKVTQCNKHMTQLAEFEAERLSLLNRDNNMKSEIADIKAKYSVMQNKLNEKERLFKEQRSVTDKLTNDLKQIRSRNTGVEARCASQEEVISTLKQQLDTAKITEKEFRESSRSLSASQQNTISRLEARVRALTVTVDKQTSLADNLRKQNVLLQTEGALIAFEKEYCDFLKQDL
ncbi:hypothetical protein KGM_214548 [Danaus plexippus plexippus]|uniref:Uncharacterized protein n=1 Tax=Danaus plexippus plexippus TaxID=278856 RepID=A0A212FI66_DANPL|nr:hypothetical protein KGM_214548 [Danaus plexippus plexippus]